MSGDTGQHDLRAARTKALTARRLIAVIEAPSREAALGAAQAVIRVGITAIEIGLSTPGAIDIIGQLSQGAKLIVGAGHVIAAEGVERIVKAGAAFVASPHTDPGVVHAAHRLGAIAFCGALTPNEIIGARHMGADVVKVFPVDAVGGARFLRQLRGPWSDIPLCAAGDVAGEHIPELLRSGAAMVELTTALFGGGMTDPGQIAARAKGILDALGPTA